MRAVLLFFMLIIFLSLSCKKQNTVIWTSYSNFLADSINIKARLPNVLQQKTAIEYECMGSPEILHVYHLCLIENDTGLVKISTTIQLSNKNTSRKEFTSDTIEKIDSTFLDRLFENEHWMPAPRWFQKK